MFITEEDYKVVIGNDALKVITQTDEANRANAEAEAIEEISGYLRPRYDCVATFAAEGATQPTDSNAYLRYRPLSHGVGYAPEDGL